MRFNGAMTQGHEADVGSSNGSRAVRCAWRRGWEDATDSHYVNHTNILAPSELLIKTAPSHYMDPGYATGAGRGTHAEVAIRNAWVDRSAVELLNASFGYPSTGFVGLAVALAVADEVSREGNAVAVPPPCGAGPRAPSHGPSRRKRDTPTGKSAAARRGRRGTA